MSRPIIISGTGCSLIDNLYTNLDFRSDVFQPYLSKKKGDGGLTPGQLVFTEEFEKFSKKNISEILNSLIGQRPPDAYNIGGPCIVALINAAQLTWNINTKVNFYGARGNDIDGEHLSELLSKTPVNISKYKISDKATPYTNVLSDPEYDKGHGERIFINNIGAAWEFRPDDLDDDFFNSDIVVFGATALVPHLHDNLTSLLKKAKERGSITVVNTVFDFRNEKLRPDLKWPLGESDETYNYIDLLITDHEEALRLSGMNSIKDAGDFFISNKTGAFAITHGINPVHIFSSGRFFKPQAVINIPVSEMVISELKERPELAGDTTGCGDNFAGGMIASLAMQLHKSRSSHPDISQAAKWGIASGGFACYYVGGTWFEDKPGEKMQKILPIYEALK